MSRPQALKRLVAAAVLDSLCSALCLTNNIRVRAANNPLPTTSNTKISPDLRQLILSGNGNARVKVIVQSKPSSTGGLLGGLLNTVGELLVGASNSFGTDPRNDDAITSYSSRGPTRSFSVDSYGLVHYDNLIKPDLVAPGNKIISAEAVNNSLVKQYPELETNRYSTSLNYNMWVKTVSLGNSLTKSDGSALFGGSYVLSNACCSEMVLSSVTASCWVTVSHWAMVSSLATARWATVERNEVTHSVQLLCPLCLRG